MLVLLVISGFSDWEAAYMGTDSMRGKPNWAQWYYDDINQNQKTAYRSASLPSSPAAVHNRSRNIRNNQQGAPVVDWGVLRHYWKERQKDHGNIYHRSQTKYVKSPGGYVSYTVMFNPL